MRLKLKYKLKKFFKKVYDNIALFFSKLRQNSQQKEEWLRAVCNHQSEDGLSTLMIDPETGEAVCTVCGNKFKPVD